jgi:AhpC/TSA family
VTRLQAVIGANVLLGIVAVSLIATDSREEGDSSRLTELTITGPLKVYTLPLPSTYEQRTVVPAKHPKPPIAGPDLMTGKHVTLSQFRGVPVFVSVWNSQNVGSLEQASTIGRWARSHESQVAYLGIDSGDSQRDGRAFARRYQMTFPSIWDPVEKFYAWGYVPTTLFFDREHKLVQKIYGGVTPAQLNAALRRVTRR